MLMLVSALRGAVVGVLFTFLYTYAYSIGMSMEEIGAATSVAVVVGSFCALLAGVLTDVFGGVVVMVLSMFLMALSSSAPLLLPGALGVWTALILFNMSFMTWVTGRGAVVSRSVEGSLASAFAQLTLSFQFARAASPYLFGVLIAHRGYSAAFMLCTALSIVGLLATLGVKERRVCCVSGTVEELIKGLVPSRRELPLHFVLALDITGWRLWLPILNPYLMHVYGLREDAIGLVNTVMNAATIASLTAAGKLVDKLGWVPVLAASDAVAALSAAILVLGQGTGIAAAATAMALMGVSLALWAPSFNVAVPDIIDNPREVGRAYSRANFYRGIASAPAPWIGGALYTIAPTHPFIAGLTILAINALLIQTLLKQKH